MGMFLLDGEASAVSFIAYTHTVQNVLLSHNMLTFSPITKTFKMANNNWMPYISNDAHVQVHPTLGHNKSIAWSMESLYP